MLKSKVFFLLSATALAATLPTVGCGGGDEDSETPASTAGAGGGKAGSAGKAGTGGTTGGTGGTAGKAGSGGTTGGTGGTAGKAGSGGTTGGTGGTAGKAGSGGGGTGGTAGKAGSGGGGAGGSTGGTGGTAGKAGTGGTAGGGAGGSTGGTGGTAGKAGTGGTAGGGAGGSTGGTAGSAGKAGGGAVANVSTAKADFGLVDCGGSAPGNQQVTINNTGTADLTVSASVSGSNAFSIVGNASITVAPGQSGTITVAAAAVPASATAGAAIQGTLTLATNDPAKPSVTVALSETPQGATLTWVTPASGSYDFGQVSTGSTGKSGALDLKNTGNAPADITWGKSSSADFSIAPGTATVAAGASVSGLEASYTPTADGAASGSIPFTTTSVLCGTNASKLDVSGSGVSGAITVSGDIDFGSNPCGGNAAAPQKITLTNSGAGSYTFTATNGNTNAYTVSPASGTVPAGGSFEITVTPAAIPFPSPVPGSYADAVTIKTSIPGDVDHLVNLTQTAKGAIVTFSQSAITFTGVPVNGTTSTNFDIQNTGNQAAIVKMQVTNTPVFGATPGTDMTVVAGTPSSATVSFSPLDNTPQTGEITLVVTDPATVLCEPLPSALMLNGTGLNGGVLLDTQAVDFGQVDCGTTAGVKTIKLTNNGNAPFDWTGTLSGANAAQFTVAPLSGTALAPGASVDITVTPSQVAQFGGIAQLVAQLQINTTVINDVPHNIAITETPRGAVLAWGPTVDFNEVPISKTASQNAILTNTGNAPASVSYAVTAGKGTAAGEFTLASATGTAAVGDTNVGASFNPVAPPGTKTATLNVSSSDVLCAPTPAGVTLTGKATIGAYVQSGNYAFGATNCGATAAPKSITITNSGTTDFNLTGISLVNNQWYTVSQSGTTVTPAGGASPAVTVTLTPKQIPFPSTPGSYNDTLQITTDIPGDTPHLVAVTQSSQGAILQMQPTNLVFADTQVNTQDNVQYLLRNTGNLPANVSFAIGSGGPWFSIDPKTVAGGSQIVADARFTPSNVQAYSDTATLNVSNTVLCQPLPANTQAGAITLAGKGITAGSGVYSMTPSSATFGAIGIVDNDVAVGIYCGSGFGTDAKVFTLKNDTVVPVNFTATLTAGGANYTLSAANGTIGAGQQFPLTVSSNAIPIDALPGSHRDGTLQVVMGGNTYTAPLTTVVAGTNLKFLNAQGSPIVALNLTGSGIGFIETFSMKNDGNAQFNYFLQTQQSGGGQTFWFYPWGPNTIGNYGQINLGAQASVQDGVYWYGNANSTGNYIVVEPAPITTGRHCTANYTGFLVTH